MPLPTLRPYQERAVSSVWDFIRTRDGNPCVVLPTGSGKSLVVAKLVTDAVERWGARVLVCAHVKELLEQLDAALRSLCPAISIGLYSAGLGSRVTGACTIAGIQSIWKRAMELFGADPPAILIVDEAHLISPEGEGMYRTLIADLGIINPDLRVIGLTATPYRTGTGLIVGEGQMFDAICYEANVLDLIRAGFLSPLKSIESADAIDTSGLHVRSGEYIPAEIDAITCDEGRVAAAVKEIVTRTRDHLSVLVFASSITHGGMVAAALMSHGVSVSEIYGDSPSAERADTVAQFRAGAIKYLVNVSVLTTGFDAPGIDCIVMLRPTKSPGLYYQMCGRGLRKAPGKDGCLVLDFAGNVNEHGPIDKIRVPFGKSGDGIGAGDGARFKTCFNCQAAGIPLPTRVCPNCGIVLIDDEVVKHEAKPYAAALTSDQCKPEVLEVDEVNYRVWAKRGNPDAPRTLRVDYICGLRQVSEWVCVEHNGFAREKALAWWYKRAGNHMCPMSAVDACDQAKRFPKPETITVEADGEYDRVTGATFAERGDAYEEWETRDPRVPRETQGIPDDGIPF